MNVTCDKCSKRYSIADDKVRGKSVKIRCKQCQNLISVQGPATVAAGAELGGPGDVGQWEEERTRAMPAMDINAEWFAMVKGKQLGPFDLKGLEGKIKTGELTLRTYLWKQGMSDWKRASDVPEVSPVFAGVAVGAPSTAPALPPPSERPSKKLPGMQRDVAVALETPSPEITARKTNGNGNGNGHVGATENAVSNVTPPVAREKISSKSRIPAVDRPSDSTPVPSPTGPLPEAEKQAPLSDLFAEGAPGDAAPDENAAGGEQSDPFAALGEPDASQLPPPGEATKFFIAQAGVNKRNPPWKIALFVLGGPGLIFGALFLLSTLKIVPLEVTRTNEKGEEVKESFFSSGGVSGLKDLLSGEAKKKKAEADKVRLAVERKRREAAVAENNVDKPNPDKPVDSKAEAAERAKLALVYGIGEKETKGPRVRLEDRSGQAAVDSAGLSPEAAQKVIGDKIKAFEGCVEQALRRNPNLSVGSIDVVLNIGASGAVVTSSIVPSKHNNSEWGLCMRDVGKRIVFPKSDGETEVSVPLKVGVALSP